VAERFGAGPVDVSLLSAANVTGFVRRRAGALSGDIEKDLAACIPAVANWKQSTLPRALPSDQVEQVLNSVNRKTAIGRRDYAILLILARMGLRPGEIRALTLEDLDWQEGLITVRGKAGRFSQLPLPRDAGGAIADYLRYRRPATSSRCVFLRAKAPAGGFQAQSGVGSMVRHALERAGIDPPRKGAHQFRHALACQMLKQGASLSEIKRTWARVNPPNQTAPLMALAQESSARVWDQFGIQTAGRQEWLD